VHGAVLAGIRSHEPPIIAEIKSSDDSGQADSTGGKMRVSALWQHVVY